MSENDDLWNVLCQMAATSKKKKTGTATTTIPKDELAARRAERTAAMKPQWQDKEIVLILHEAQCSTCDSRYQWPNDRLMIKKAHPTLGEHYVQASLAPTDPEAYYLHLPQRTEYQFYTVQACQRCFDLAHIIDKQRGSPHEPA